MVDAYPTCGMFSSPVVLVPIIPARGIEGLPPTGRTYFLPQYINDCPDANLYIHQLRLPRYYAMMLMISMDKNWKFISLDMHRTWCAHNNNMAIWLSVSYRANELNKQMREFNYFILSIII